MYYRIISTTDGQHRGKIIFFEGGDIELDDLRIETLFAKDNDDGTKTISDSNYIMTLEAI